MSTYSQDDFWAAYDEYALNSRHVHKRAITALLGACPVPQQHSVLDLGCGRTQIFKKLFPACSYVGVDKHATSDTIVPADFQEPGVLNALVSTYKPWLVTSLFSMDVVQPLGQSNALCRLIMTCPSVEYILTSGFYYVSKYSTNPIQERLPNGDVLTSWQVNSPLLAPAGGSGLTEARLILPNPSELFGSDVFEVWRLISRQPQV